MITEIEKIIQETLPGFWFQVYEMKVVSGKWIAIKIAAKDYNINRVEGQKPQAVSLRLEPDKLILEPQIYGGNGGQCIYRQPNLNDPKEKYLAMQGVKVPFRRPKPDKESVLKAIRRFCEAYKQTLIDNIEVLTDQNIVDYKALLKA